MEVLDAERMRRADREAIEGMKIPGLVLMENAGLRTAEVMADEIEDLAQRRVWIVAGAGNNGGDGFVVARHLARTGVAVDVVLVGATRSALNGDAAAMAEAWVGLGGDVIEVLDDGAADEFAAQLLAGDVIVDALFGTGLTRPLDGLAARVVEAINDAGGAGATVVAVDIPSGLFSSDPQVSGPAVRADVTVTFARPKPAHLLPPAEDLCGDVVVVDIGIPPAAVVATEPDLHWVLLQEAALLVPEREADDHKGRYGHVLVVGGSSGKAGAAAMTGLGALRAGAGLVTVAAPAPVRSEVASFAAELMTEELPASKYGFLTRGAAAPALELAGERSVLALGPGLGQTPGTQVEVRRLVKESPVPVVLDADGVNAFAGRIRELARHDQPLIVTPHPGEAARLLGVDAAAVQSDRVGSARRIAAATRAVCVLKGYRTIIAAPDGQAFINPTGNPGLASGGSGDVLTGIVAGLVAQGVEPLEAAVLGAYLHGLAADAAIDEGETEPTLTATVLLDFLPDAYRRLLHPAEREVD
ncbi:MAG: NAD(P)H-hydrate dehydratase [Acidobacteria bacterium]|nr:NAD(P)H-hydrate dehydratase [Acidobacteriota bacterium]